MGHLALDEIFKHMLQLKRFGFYFEGILNRKWLVSYRKEATSQRVSCGASPGEAASQRVNCGASPEEVVA